jgi:hypothetical protein
VPKGGRDELKLRHTHCPAKPIIALPRIRRQPQQRAAPLLACCRSDITDSPDDGQISLTHSRRFISLVRPSTAPNRLRQKANFVNEFKLIWVVRSWL